ncbi:MAG: rod shape-determining protein RodA [Lentisphaerae bacterium]|nr:rod shape-determining protein RodA [Lentisphaerota bacterium]
MTPTMDDLRRLRRLNWVMTGAVLLLAAIGVLFVYSASCVSGDQPARLLYKRQIVWAVVGAACYLGCAAADYRKLNRFAWLAYAAGIALLVLVLLIGRRVYGARRWLMVFDIGIQPSELAKLLTLIALAAFLSRPRTGADRPRTWAAVAAATLLPMGLILKQPDLGTAMVFVPMAAAALFTAGLPMRVVTAALAAGALAVGLLLGALVLPERMGLSAETQRRFQAVTGLSDYQKARITAFFNPDQDPLGVGWNRKQSEIAVGSGGTWGKGFRKGTQNILGFLPRTVAPTDFVYSVIAEETGFVGSVVVLLLFGTIFVSGLRTALACRERMGRILCVGVVALLFTHVFVNIAMTVGLMPITGIPLPLLSYGGSIMLMTMCALGLVQSVHVRTGPAVTLLSGVEPA